LDKMIAKLEQTIGYLKGKVSFNPQIGLILGSGLGVLAEEIEEPFIIPYEDIPNFPVSTVTGHKGQLVFGKLQGKDVVAMQGRFHFYEGYSIQEVTYPVRVMKKLGVETLIVTNAAGGTNSKFEAGDLVLISDHINLTGTNPLIGPNYDEFGPRFPDMTEAYAPELRKTAEEAGDEQGIPLKDGVYGGLAGPSYETPAEINYLKTIGVDMVGMSTVAEVIVARHAGIKVLGISCITNMAAGLGHHLLSHDEVMDTAEKTKSKFLGLVRLVVQRL